MSVRKRIGTHITDVENPCPFIIDGGYVRQPRFGSQRNRLLRGGLRQSLGFDDWWNLREIMSVAKSRRKLFSVPVAEQNLLPAAGG